MTSDRGSLLLITGSPRSTTTAFHNALIQAGIYRGILADDLADRDPALDPGLYTDEYHPSLRLPLMAEFAAQPTEREAAKDNLQHELDRLVEVFGVARGLMLKAPHYVYGLSVYREMFGSRLKIIFTHRDPFSVAASMIRHPHISQQLPRDIDACTDFLEFDLYGRYAEAETVDLARSFWSRLTLFERALFVWWIFASAFLSHRTAQSGTLVIRNDAFTQSLDRLAKSLDLDEAEAASFARRYNALPRAERDLGALSMAGRTLWNRLRPAEIKLDELAI